MLWRWTLIYILVLVSVLLQTSLMGGAAPYRPPRSFHWFSPTPARKLLELLQLTRSASHALDITLGPRCNAGCSDHRGSCQTIRASHCPGALCKITERVRRRQQVSTRPSSRRQARFRGIMPDGHSGEKHRCSHTMLRQIVPSALMGPLYFRTLKSFAESDLLSSVSLICSIFRAAPS